MATSEGRQQKPYPLRMDDGLKSWLAVRAKKSNRSINGEVITILEGEREKEVVEVEKPKP